jgi:hypothetical protein
VPAGLTVINDWGTYQIDDTTYNLSFISKGSAFVGCDQVNSEGNFAAVSQFAFNIQGPLENPVIALRMDNDMGFGIYNFQWTQNVDLYTVEVNIMSDNPAVLSGTLTWYVFDRPKAIGSGNSGLEVYDANGKLKFSSANAPMRIVSANGGQMPAGRTYAVACAFGTSGYTEQSDSLGNVFYQASVNGAHIGNNGTLIEGYGTSWGGRGSYGAPPGSGGGLTASNLLVVDVTGL